MPVTIKHELIKYKDSSGNYVGINGISTQKTEEELAAIEAKGDEVIASIPSDYTDLTGQVSDLKEDISLIEEYGFFKKQILNISQHTGTNTAVTFNNDGSATVGTTDYGNTFWGSPITLKAGKYYLFGVSHGYSFVATTLSHSTAFVTNSTNQIKEFELASEQSVYVGFRMSSAPSESFTIYPALYQMLSLTERDYYTILPTGDSTDRYTELTKALSLYKAVFFPEGEYTISTKLTLPSGSKFFGIGKSSVIKFGSSATGIMIECGNDCQISNLKFDGGLSSRPNDLDTNRIGIRIKDNTQTLQMHDCHICGFGKYGVCIDNTGYAQLSSVQINNCYFQYNGVGIFFMEHGEYGVVANCSFIDNNYGTLVKGGNNIITGCALERNNHGGSVNGNGINNSGHGAFIGCSFNHNKQIGLEVIATSNGYVVSGCQMFRNESYDIHVDAAGVNVCGCNFGVSPKVSMGSDAIILITNNMFGSQPTMSVVPGAIVKGANNYTFAGNAVSALNTI